MRCNLLEQEQEHGQGVVRKRKEGPVQNLDQDPENLDQRRKIQRKEGDNSFL